jgi:hypothetical protein
MYACILSQDGERVLHCNLQTTPESFLQAMVPYRDDPVVSVSHGDDSMNVFYDSETKFNLKT